MRMTLKYWTRTDMDQIVMERVPAAASPDDEVFHFPDGIKLPPSHPGDTLGEELAARGLTANALALKLRVPANRISDIVRGRRAITAETALRLGRYLGTGARFWVDLQAAYDLAVAERDWNEIVDREVDPAG
jgi:addiction module HigA family antidote